LLFAGAVRLSLTLASFASIALLVSACGDSVDDVAKAAGGTPAPDGSDGYCCPASEPTVACALVGGYQTEGECPKKATLCDNLCSQKVVKDDHGCAVFTYETCPTPVGK
jgi:hypothetical protein